MDATAFSATRRRLVLTGLFGLCGGGLLQACGDIVGPPASGDGLVDLPRLFQYPEGARSLGAAYLRDLPLPVTAQELESHLLFELQRIGHGKVPADCWALIDMLGGLMIDEFIAGRTVQVDDWLLGLSEARLYALLAMQSSASA